MKNRKIVVIAFVLIAALALGIGYASVTTTLTVDGRGILNGQSILNAAISYKNGEIQTKNGIKNDTLGTVTFNENNDQAVVTIGGLTAVGEEAVVLLVVQNLGAVDATLSFDENDLAITNNDAGGGNEYFDITIDQTNNGATVAANGGTVPVKIHVKLATVPTSSDDVTVTFTFEYTATSVS